MTIANQVASHHNIVAQGQIDCRFALIVLAVEEFIVFDRDVMRLIELDQIQPVVILQWIVGGSAAVGRTLVVNLAIANCDVTGPQDRDRTTSRITTWRIIRLNAVELLFRFINAVAMNSIAPRIQFFPAAS